MKHKYNINGLFWNNIVWNFTTTTGCIGLFIDTTDFSYTAEEAERKKTGK